MEGGGLWGGAPTGVRRVRRLSQGGACSQGCAVCNQHLRVSASFNLVPLAAHWPLSNPSPGWEVLPTEGGTAQGTAQHGLGGARLDVGQVRSGDTIQEAVRWGEGQTLVH